MIGIALTEHAFSGSVRQLTQGIPLLVPVPKIWSLRCYPCAWLCRLDVFAAILDVLQLSLASWCPSCVLQLYLMSYNVLNFTFRCPPVANILLKMIVIDLSYTSYGAYYVLSHSLSIKCSSLDVLCKQQKLEMGNCFCDLMPWLCV
jgi:hypothetical protein